MYRNLDNSGSLFLSHYNSLIPTLGPCGFSRNQETYHITTPRIHGKIECNELKILGLPSDSIYVYTGFIAFLRDNIVHVKLYKTSNNIKTKLSINGKHRIKVENNEISKQK